jgi:hypothetical protein
MRKLASVAVAAAVVVGAAALAPADALARGAGAAGGFIRGGVVLRGPALRALFVRRAFLGHHFHFNRGQSAWGGPAVFGPPAASVNEPPEYPVPPPTWRECMSYTRMVPSSTHAGLVPVVVTGCRNRS